MRRGLRAVVTGLMVIGAGALGGTAIAAAGPVATPPPSPPTQTVAGVAANGVQLSMTVPTELPLDLPGQPLPEREVDVTATDVGGQGFTGDVNVTLASEGQGVDSVALRLDHYDLATGAWEAESIPSGQGSFAVTDSVTIPGGGSQVLKLRLSPGTTAVQDVKVTASANGASAVAAIPVAGPAFQASGLTASARVGVATVVTGKLTNPMDVGLQHVPVVLMLCPSGSAGCVAHASDVKVEVLSGGAWHGVSVADAAGSVPMHATVLPDLTLAAGGTAQFSVRVTVGAGAFGASGASGSGSGSSAGSAPGPGSGTASALGQPPAQSAQPLAVPMMLGPVGLTLVGQPLASGTLTVQAPPQPTPSVSSTPSTSPSSSPTPDPTTSSADGLGGTPSASATPTPAPASSIEAASTPGASSSSSPTILVAAGLLAVCLALLLWWTLMKRRERMAREDAAHQDSAM